MKTKWIVVISVLALLSVAATIKFFTDYPNGGPLDSDFFVYQRNQSYGNASGSQMKSYLWANPAFTGNGSISGAFGIGGFSTVGGSLSVGGNVTAGPGASFFGNGSGLTNVGSGFFLLKTNDIGNQETFVGPTTFTGTGNGVLLGSGTYLFNTGISNAIAWWSTDGSLSNVLIGTGLQLANGVISATASSTNSSTTATNMYTYNTNAAGYGIFTNGAQFINVTSPSVAGFDSSKNITNINLAARFSLSANTLDIAAASIPNGDLQNSQITVNGTANQVIVSASPVSLGGSTTLSLPQSINAGASPFFNGVNMTNLNYQYLTNSSVNGALTFASTAYWTNISADTTLAAFTLGNPAMYETMVIMVKNTDSAVHKVTPPNGVMTMPGNVAAGAVFCTNGVVTEIDVAHWATLQTNLTVKQ